MKKKSRNTSKNKAETNHVSGKTSSANQGAEATHNASSQDAEKGASPDGEPVKKEESDRIQEKTETSGEAASPAGNSDSSNGDHDMGKPEQDDGEEKKNRIRLSEIERRENELKQKESQLKGREDFLSEWESNLESRETELAKKEAIVSHAQKMQEDYHDKLAQLEADRLSLTKQQAVLKDKLEKLPDLEARESQLAVKLADYEEKKKQLDEDFKTERQKFEDSLKEEKRLRLSAYQEQMASAEQKAREAHEKAENDWNSGFLKRSTESEMALTKTLADKQKEFDEGNQQKINALTSREEKLNSDLRRLAEDEEHYAELERNAESVQREKRKNEHERQRLEERDENINSVITTQANRLFEQTKRYYEEERKKNNDLVEAIRTERDQAQQGLHCLRRIFDRAQADNRLNGRDENDLVDFYMSLKAVVARYDSIHEQTEDTSSKVPEEIKNLEERLRLREEERNKLAKDLNEAKEKIYSEELLQGEIERLNGLIEDRKKTINEWKAERKLRERESQTEIKSRISDIRRPSNELVKKVNERGRQEFISINEVKWLENIRWKMAKNKTPFSKRILYSFHTALKTGEWSPLTVLAGISGTGKSLLPKLYADFGGLNFLSIPVQPTWDSSDALLGFFNSLTGKFEAQPLLKYLAQTQLWNPLYYQYEDELKVDQTSENGLRDTMSIVLLDEMNLAHIELYFADFLSKLEERRSAGTENLPCLEIPITGNETYSLSLGRNVLWVGTMNQDETTKSLSDKVLDRGAIIDFPRPHTFKSRTELQEQTGDLKPEKLIGSDTWASWNYSINGEKLPFEEKDVQEYKTLVEEINEKMAVAGRAIGHRVWQSMEMYMANYPLVSAYKNEHGSDEWRNALQTAFEDQLIQKVMPKLRGIETTGKTKTDCLMEIQKKLEGNVSDDFMKDFADACSDRNYGQFIWSSAHYYAEQPGDSEVDETMPNPVQADGEIHQYRGVIFLDPESLEPDTEKEQEQVEEEENEAPAKEKKEGGTLNQVFEKLSEKLSWKQAPARDASDSTDKGKTAGKKEAALADRKESDAPAEKPADIPQNDNSPKKAPGNNNDPKVKMFEVFLKNGFAPDEADEFWKVFPDLLKVMKNGNGKIASKTIQCYLTKYPALKSKTNEIRNVLNSSEIKKCIELL